MTSGDGDDDGVGPEHVARAEELVRQGVTVLPVPRVAQVLGMAQAGVSQRRIAATVPAHRKTVASIVGAAGGGGDVDEGVG